MKKILIIHYFGNSKNQQNKNTILSTSNSYSYLYNNNEKNDKIKNSNEVLLFGNPNNLSNTIYLNINDEKPKSLFNKKNENSNGLLNINSTNSSKGIAFPDNINDNNNEINNKINDGNELNENKKISLNTNQLFPVKKEENNKNTNLFGTNNNNKSLFGINDNNKSLFEKFKDKNTEKKEVLSSNNYNSNLNIFNHSKINNSLFKNKNEENSILLFSVLNRKKYFKW